MKKSGLVLLWLIGAYAVSSNAYDEQWQARDEISYRVGVGVGEIETPIALHDDRRLHLLPQLAWYGERVYFDNGLIGFALSEHKQRQWDWVAYLNDDGLLYRLSNELTPLITIQPIPYPGIPNRITLLKRPERHLSTMMGLRFAQQTERAEFSVQAGADVSDVHHGWEIQLRGSHALIRDDDLWQVTLDLGATLKSGSLIDYYYTPEFGEISPVEGEPWQTCSETPLRCETQDNGPYQPNAGWRTHLGVHLNYRLSEHWSLAAHYRHYQLSSEFTQSPIVTRDHYAAWFAGFVYGNH